VHLAALFFRGRAAALIGITDPHHRDGPASSLRKRTAGKAVQAGDQKGDDLAHRQDGGIGASDLIWPAHLEC
jgi:hypothetical protein